MSAEVIEGLAAAARQAREAAGQGAAGGGTGVGPAPQQDPPVVDLGINEAERVDGLT